jgi:RNA polymerase sigma factor (sigma-70 family)
MSSQPNNLTTGQRNELALSHRDFATAMAVKFSAIRKANIEEMKSAAFEGLCYASTLYEPTLGFAFSTYAYFWIRDRLTKEADRYHRRGFKQCPNGIQQISDTDDRRSDGLGFFKGLKCREERPDKIVEKSEFYEKCLNIVGTPRERQVFEMMFRDGLSSVDVAKKLKVSKQRIDQLKQKALKRIRVALKETT